MVPCIKSLGHALSHRLWARRARQSSLTQLGAAGVRPIVGRALPQRAPGQPTGPQRQPKSGRGDGSMNDFLNAIQLFQALKAKCEQVWKEPPEKPRLAQVRGNQP